MYTIHILKTAGREFGRLDPPIAKRIASRIQWLAENPDQSNPIALKGEVVGLFKLREGGLSHHLRGHSKRTGYYHP